MVVVVVVGAVPVAAVVGVAVGAVAVAAVVVVVAIIGSVAMVAGTMVAVGMVVSAVVVVLAVEEPCNLLSHLLQLTCCEAVNSGLLEHSNDKAIYLFVYLHRCQDPFKIFPGQFPPKFSQQHVWPGKTSSSCRSSYNIIPAVINSCIASGPFTMDNTGGRNTGSKSWMDWKMVEKGKRRYTNKI